MSSTSALPLVSCIMPTFNRRAFVPRAIHYFRRQNYPSKELLVVDDGTDPIGDLIPADMRIRYIRSNKRMTVGAKRNLACEQALGEVVAHWDDDDWHAPHRLRYQLAGLQASGKDICGLNRILFFDVERGCAWRYVYANCRNPWLSGSTLCYTRALWQGHRFANVNVGEDRGFVAAVRRERMVALQSETFHVGLIHRTNLSPKRPGAYWNPYPLESMRELLGEDWNDLHGGASGGS